MISNRDIKCFSDWHDFYWLQAQKAVTEIVSLQIEMQCPQATVLTGNFMLKLQNKDHSCLRRTYCESNAQDTSPGTNSKFTRWEQVET